MHPTTLCQAEAAMSAHAGNWPVLGQVIKPIAGARMGHNSAYSMIEYTPFQLMTVVENMKD